MSHSEKFDKWWKSEDRDGHPPKRMARAAWSEASAAALAEAHAALCAIKASQRELSACCAVSDCIQAIEKMWKGAK